MMRRTAACAGLALALYLSAWITIERPPSQVRQPISFDGIDVVVFQKVSPTIRFSSSRSEAEYDSTHFPRLLELRKGRVLVLRPEGEYYRSYDIHMPPTVKRVVSGHPTIKVEEGARLTTLELRVNGGLDWNGDIPHLLVVDDAPPADCRSCGSSLEIRGGIGHLRVSTIGGQVELAEPDKLGRITLALGPTASYSLNFAQRPPSLRILPRRAGLGDQPVPEKPLP